MKRSFPSALLFLLFGCDHSGPFPSAGPEVGPASAGPDVQLTFNVDQNYWPTLTEDGSAILYAFVDQSARTVIPTHRCIGAMRVAGGTRFWEWCDNRANQADSSSSFPAFAMGSDGRLLYAEVVVPTQFPFQVPQAALWLADSAAPFRRRALATLPIVVGDSSVSWFADLAWTGPTTFVGLGQRMIIGAHCKNCSDVDSVFYGEAVVRGTISDAGATITAVSGTVGATGYSLAEGGSSIVFTQRDNMNLMKVPFAGGAPVVAAVTTTRTGMQLLGVSCRGTSCVVALGPATLFRRDDETGPPVGTGPFELRSVSLTTGAATTILSRNDALSTPLLLPSGDVIAQVGAGFGHLQTFSSSAITLHRFKGLVP